MRKIRIIYCGLFLGICSSCNNDISRSKEVVFREVEKEFGVITNFKMISANLISEIKGNDSLDYYRENFKLKTEEDLDYFDLKLKKLQSKGLLLIDSLSSGNNIDEIEKALKENKGRMFELDQKINTIKKNGNRGKKTYYNNKKKYEEIGDSIFCKEVNVKYSLENPYDNKTYVIQQVFYLDGKEKSVISKGKAVILIQENKGIVSDIKEKWEELANKFN